MVAGQADRVMDDPVVQRGVAGIGIRQVSGWLQQRQPPACRRAVDGVERPDKPFGFLGAGDLV